MLQQLVLALSFAPWVHRIIRIWLERRRAAAAEWSIQTFILSEPGRLHSVLLLLTAHSVVQSDCLMDTALCCGMVFKFGSDSHFHLLNWFMLLCYYKQCANHKGSSPSMLLRLVVKGPKPHSAGLWSLCTFVSEVNQCGFKNAALLSTLAAA